MQSNTEQKNLTSQLSPQKGGPLPILEVDDPLQLFLMKWWKQLLLGVLAVIAIFWGRMRFEQHQREAAGARSDAISKVSTLYKEYQTQLETQPLSDTKLEEERKKNIELSKKRFEESLKSAAETAPEMAILAQAYTAQISSKEAKDDQASYQKWREASLKAGERFVAELRAYSFAKEEFVNLELAPEKRAQAKNELVSLVKEASYFAAPSAKLIKDLARNEDEHSEADQLISLLTQRQPEQGEIFNNLG